jgi:two-component system OmpR family response regulator
MGETDASEWAVERGFMPRIAVVDDDAILLAVMRELLEDEGYVVDTYAAGEDETHVALKASPPDLVILDLRIGALATGVGLLSALRLDPATAATPILVCTADGAYLRDNGAHLAAQGVRTLAKPFDLEALLAHVRALAGPPTA